MKYPPNSIVGGTVGAVGMAVDGLAVATGNWNVGCAEGDIVGLLVLGAAVGVNVG